MTPLEPRRLMSGTPGGDIAPDTLPVPPLAATIPLAAPAALTAAVQSSTHVMVNWTNSGQVVSGFYILRSTDGVHFSQIANIGSPTASSYTDNNAKSGTNNYYFAEAYAGNVTSAASNLAACTTPLAAPSRLTVAVQSGNQQLKWNNNDSSATGYYVLRATDGVHFAPLATLNSGGTNNYTDTSVTPGVVYTYEVEAFDAATTSPASNTASLSALTAPSGLNAAVQNGAVKLNWNDNGSAASGYSVLRSVNGSSFSLLVTLNSSGANNYTDNTTGPGATYTYEVQAFDRFRTSPISNTASANLPSLAPSNLIAKQSGAAIDLSWTDNDRSAAGYLVFRSSDGITFAQIAQLNSPSAASYSDSAIAAGQTFYYEVKAYYANGSASAPSNAGTVTVPSLAPSSLLASATGSWVNLTWTDNDPLAAGYWVLRSSDGVTFTQIAQLTSASAASYADASVSAGQPYAYEIEAYYGSGATSASSNVASVVTPTASAGGGDVAITTRYGDELVITLSGPDDSVAVSQSGSVLTIVADGTTYTDAATAGGLFVYTRGGTDSISIASSVTEATTVETIDGATDTISSGDSSLIAWVDASDSFSGMGTVRRVSSFAGGLTRALGASLPNPSDSGSTVTVNLSLFGTGPAISDVNQGEAGDCYFLSSLAAFAGEKPSVLTDSAVDMGDGTYAVDFNGTYVRVSNQFPVGPFNGFADAQPGPNQTIWAMVMEKAFAYYRTGANTYASTDNGWMGEAYSDFGVSSSMIYPGSYSQSGFYSAMANDLANGQAVTFLTGSGTSLVSDHCYTLVSVYTDSSGVAHYVVRNPWGVSGDALENSQGYATLTYAQMVANFGWGCMAVA